MAELVREIVIDATPETIWPFLTESEKHADWIGSPAELDPRPGGVYRASMGGGAHPAAGTFVEVVPLEKVVFTFGWDEKDHPIPPGSTTLEISLHPEGDKTRVRLVHTRPAGRRGRRPRQRLGALPRASVGRRDRAAIPVPTGRRDRGRRRDARRGVPAALHPHCQCVRCRRAPFVSNRRRRERSSL